MSASTLTRPTETPASLPTRRKAKFFGIDKRPGWLTYSLLGVFFLCSAYPLWWSFVMGTRLDLASPSPWRKFLEERR
jgi:cellobiose transport system permease protein